jgi:hypothetical protein
METGRNLSMSGINSGRWNQTMLNLCGIMVAILKMATARNFSMSGINSGHHNLPTYEMSLKSDNAVDNDVPNWFPTLKNFYRSPISKWSPQYRTNSTLSDVNAISYVGRLWCPELIPDIDKFLLVAIFKMVAIIPHKFNIVWFQRPELVEFVRYCGSYFENGDQ